VKLLRSPWVSGVLAVVALVVVCYQLLPLHGASALAVVAPPPAPAAPAPPPNTVAAAENPAPKPAELPCQPVDRTVLEARFGQWLEAPGRDPFWLVPARSQAAVHQYPSPVLVWKLKAIWRQTNGRVAVIDNRTYAEGDKLDGYRIQKIEADRVVFEGPDGPEVLTFSQAGASPAAKKK
jgi:hypothetical protein